jgi:hypothetical protein
MSRSGEEQTAAMSRSGEEQTAAMSRSGEEQTATTRPRVVACPPATSR